VFPSLETLELALLAAMLAPTDAALGKPVVTNRTVPPVMREALNLESGLNDGICVPIVVLLLGLAVGTQIEGGTIAQVTRVVIEAIGLGAVIGLALTWFTTFMLRFAEKRGGLASTGWKPRLSRWRRRALRRHRWRAAADSSRALSEDSC
jgi:NhaP-type Na+/H+ or K+/H+ antiporter